MHARIRTSPRLLPADCLFEIVSQAAERRWTTVKKEVHVHVRAMLKVLNFVYRFQYLPSFQAAERRWTAVEKGVQARTCAFARFFPADAIE